VEAVAEDPVGRDEEGDQEGEEHMDGPGSAGRCEMWAGVGGGFPARWTPR